ncbi:MAG: DUF4058 family protein [Pirellula sp.]
MKRFNKNPFPGMNPWLESHWGDIHTKLTTYSCDAIQRALPSGLQARVEEYLAVEEEFGPATFSTRRISPDISILQSASNRQIEPQSASIAIAGDDEPFVFRRQSEPQTLRNIQIIDVKAGRRVVTVIEFLSPANKTERGKKHYQQKQRELIEASVNLVEIDLLRRGEWVIAADEVDYPVHCREPYRICVTRAETLDEGEAYSASFAFPLPRIRIPLRKDDADIRLPLQALLNQAYDNGRYAEDFDYDIAPEIPLKPNDDVVVKQVLSQSSG